MDVGQVCRKIAGRDTGICVILSKPEGSLVLVDGQVRRKKVNLRHLWALEQKLELAENADHEAVVAALKGINILVKEKTAKSVGAKPVRQRGKAKAKAQAAETSAPKKGKTKAGKPATKKAAAASVPAEQKDADNKGAGTAVKKDAKKVAEEKAQVAAKQPEATMAAEPSAAPAAPEAAAEKTA